MFVWVLMIIGVVLADQFSKLLVLNFLDPETPFVIWEGVFRFSYVENKGAAFGMLAEHRWVFMLISVIAIVALLIYLWKWRPESKFACCAIAMIAGGGIGNMIDRVSLGFVVDFLDFYLFPQIWTWVFNVADSFVCVGGGMLFLWCISEIIREAKTGKKTGKTGIGESTIDGNGADTGQNERN